MSNTTIEELQQEINLIEDAYNKVAKDSSVILKTFQWAEEKDSFDIFSMYSDKTPVISSSSTVVVKQ